MHDDVQYDRSKVKVMSPWKAEIRSFSKAISIYNGGLANDHGFLN